LQTSAHSPLRIAEPLHRALLPGALDPRFRLFPERAVVVLDAVLLAVALDLGDPAIPRLGLARIAWPLAQLRPDVGGRGDAGGGDRQLSPLRKQALDRCQLGSSRALDGRKTFGLGPLLIGGWEHKL
jgi:hypothetical protein